MEYKITFDDDKNYFGHCPIMEHENYVLNIFKNHWMYCEQCKTRWLVGSNLFGSWRHETEEIWKNNFRKIKSFKDYSGPEYTVYKH